MMSMEEKLDWITSRIFPEGNDFFGQQKSAIFTDKSINIVAGPGTGKTTVLIAKCALLLMNQENNKGICLITHTNVAVDEIKEGLRRIGISNIEYPNFIGTIQEFFKMFFSRKAFHLIHGEKDFRVLDDDVYQEKFNDKFQRVKPERYTVNSPNAKNKKPKLLIEDNLSYSFESMANEFYKDEFESSIVSLFSEGLLNNNQCLELAHWYISKYKPAIQLAIRNRFSYVMLDEAQDTGQLQYEMLNTLFADSEVVFQKYGDPYQSLYSIYDGNYDAWIPSEESTGYEEISETSRFGSTIADLVKTVCIEDYQTFTSLGLVDSFPPYFIIYEDENDLITQYKKLLRKCESQSDSFIESKKKDAILSVMHRDLEGVFKSYTKPAMKNKENEGQVMKTYNMILSIMAQELDLSVNNLKREIDSKISSKVAISKYIRTFFEIDITIEELVTDFNNILSILSEGNKNEFLKTNIEEQLEYFQMIIETAESNLSHEESNQIKIGTIHSAKGETHRSTLLMMDTVFKNFSEKTEYQMLNLLEEYLIGNYISLDSISDEIVKNETIKSLKLAYVALSRPTHLVVIGIPKRLIVDDDTIITKLSDNGWIKYEN